MDDDRTADLLDQFDTAIEQLSSNPNAAFHMSNDGTSLPSIVSAMESLIDSPAVQRKAMTILFQFAENAHAHTRITASDAVRQIVGAMERYPNMEDLQVEACRLLKELCCFQVSLRSLRRQSEYLPLERLLQQANQNFPTKCGPIVSDVLEKIQPSSGTIGRTPPAASSSAIAHSRNHKDERGRSGGDDDVTMDFQSLASDFSMDVSAIGSGSFPLESSSVTSGPSLPTKKHSREVKTDVEDSLGQQSMDISGKNGLSQNATTNSTNFATDELPKRKKIHLYIAIQAPASSSIQPYTSLSNTVCLLQTFYRTIALAFKQHQQHQQPNISFPPNMNFQLSEHLPTTCDFKYKEIQTMLLLGDFTRSLENFLLPKRIKRTSLPKLICVCMPKNGSALVKKLHQIMMGESDIDCFDIDPFHVMNNTDSSMSPLPAPTKMLSVDRCEEIVWEQMLPKLRQTIEAMAPVIAPLENRGPACDYTLSRWRNTNLIRDDASYLTARNLFGQVVPTGHSNMENFDYIKDSMQKDDKTYWCMDANRSSSLLNEAEALVHARAMVYHICCQFIFEFCHQMELHHITCPDALNSVVGHVGERCDKTILLWIDLHDCIQLPRFHRNDWEKIIQQCQSMMERTRMMNVVFTGGSEFVRFLHSCHGRIDVNWLASE